MIEKILKDNAKDFDSKLLNYSVQINALNYLKKNNNIKEELYKKVKSTITNVYTMECNKKII